MEIKFEAVNFIELKFICPHCQIYTEDRLAVINLEVYSFFLSGVLLYFLVVVGTYQS
ncbi:hypothetical protein ACE6H2_025739 [Prunus campanulata]